MKSFSESYKAAGVDITAGYAAVELMKQHVARTMTPGAIGGLGGFGGLFEAADGCVVEIDEQASGLGIDRGVDDLMRCGGVLRTAVATFGHKVGRTARQQKRCNE